MIISLDLLLVKILRIVIEVIPEVNLPIRVGRPFTYSPLVVTCCFLVMVAKRLSVRGLYKFLTRKDDAAAVAISQTIPFPDGQIPHRRTFDRRLADCLVVGQLYLLAGAVLLAKKRAVGLARLALDNRMFPACGGLWHRSYQKKGTIPKGLRNIDKLAGWGVSAYRGWIWGHALDVFVTTGKWVVPILAISRSLTIRGNTAIKTLGGKLLKFICVKRGIVVADSEYEDPKLAQLFMATGRYFHVARKRHPKACPKSKTYRRRKLTVEPLYERFLLALSNRGKLSFKGKQAWGWLMMALLLYQVAIIYQVSIHEPQPLKVTHLIHAL